MKALVIKPHSQSEIKFLSALLKKLGIVSKWMDVEEIEDIGFSMLMKQANRHKKVSRESIMKKLPAVVRVPTNHLRVASNKRKNILK